MRVRSRIAGAGDASVARPAGNAPRRPSLKRALLVLGLVVVSLAVLRRVWGWEATRRLQAKIAEYRAVGGPILLGDFVQPPIPDEDNAALPYLVPAELLVETEEQVQVEDGDATGCPPQIRGIFNCVGRHLSYTMRWCSDITGR